MDAHKDYFAQAAYEVANGQLDQTLFIKALALANGDEKIARAIYIKLRAEELHKEARAENFARTVSTTANLAAGTVATASVAAIEIAKSKPFARFIRAILSLLIPGSGQILGGWQTAGRWLLCTWLLTLSVAIGLLMYGAANPETEARESAAQDYLRQKGCTTQTAHTERCIDAVQEARAIVGNPESYGAGKISFYGFTISATLILLLHLYSFADINKRQSQDG